MAVPPHGPAFLTLAQPESRLIHRGPRRCQRRALSSVEPASTVRRGGTTPRRAIAANSSSLLVEERVEELVGLACVDPPRVVGAVARLTRPVRHHCDHLVGVVDENRTARVAEARTADAADLA